MRLPFVELKVAKLSRDRLFDTVRDKPVEFKALSFILMRWLEAKYIARQFGAKAPVSGEIPATTLTCRLGTDEGSCEFRAARRE